MTTMSKDDTSICNVQAEGEVDNIDESCTQEKSPELATEVTGSTCALLLKRGIPRDKNRAESSEIYEAKAEVKLQLSKVNEIINGFNEMWRFLAKYHRKQFQTRSKSCVPMVEKGLRKLTQKVEEHVRTFRESLKGYTDRYKSFVSVLNEWLNRNTMEEDDQTKTEAPEIFRVCSDRLRETEYVDGVKVLSTVRLFMAFTSAYYRGSVGALLLYNKMTRHSTFKNAARWLRELRGHTDPNIVVILIGNKCDLRGMVEIKTEETKAFAKRESTYFMETSALHSTNVENAFTEGLTQIHKILSKRSVDEPNKEGERGSETELRFRSLGFKQVEEDRQRLRTEKLCKELETKTNRSKEKIQNENPEADMEESTKDPKEKRKKQKGSKSDEVIFKASLNLEKIDALNSSEADDNSKNGKDDMGSSRASRTTSSSIDDTNQGKRCSVNYKSGDHNNNLSFGAGGGDIAPASRHCRSVSGNICFMDKLFFGEESLKPPPSPPGTVSRKNGAVFSIEFKNREFTAAKIKKIMVNDKLAEMAMSDPKRVKRIFANRQSTARSKERKIRYIVELEHKVQTLQTEATTLPAQFTLLQRDMMGLTNQNNKLKFCLQAMNKQAQLSDALNEALGGEVQRLKLAIGETRHNEYDRSNMQLLNVEMFQQLKISQLTQQPQSQHNHESLHKNLTLANLESASQARDEELAAMQSSSHLGERELDHMSVEISNKSKKVSVAVSRFGNKSQFLSQANEILKRQEDEIHSLQRALKEKEEDFQMSVAAKRLKRIHSCVQREKLERQMHMFRSEREGIQHEIAELKKLENLKIGLDDISMAKMKLFKIESCWEKGLPAQSEDPYITEGTQDHTQEPDEADEERLLDFLNDTPEHEYLRAMARSDPCIVKVFVEMLEEQDPPLFQLIQDNKALFLRLLLEVQGGTCGKQVGESEETKVDQPQADQTNRPNNRGDGGNVVGESKETEVEVTTPEDDELIERLEALGFQRGDAAVAYFACNKNVQDAANHLLVGMVDVYTTFSFKKDLRSRIARSVVNALKNAKLSPFSSSFSSSLSYIPASSSSLLGSLLPTAIHRNRDSPVKDKMKIYVKTLKGDRFEIQVKPEDSVADVKKNVETVLGVTSYPAAEQVLTHKGRMLKDETTVEANNVSEKSIIGVIKRKPASTGTSTSSASLKSQDHATHPSSAATETPTEPAWDDAALDLNYESISEYNIQQILEMVRGAWSRKLVTHALRLAYNDVDKALEYLYFRVRVISTLRIKCNEKGTQDQTQEPEGPGEADVDWSTLYSLRHTPEFEYIRAMVQSDPSILKDSLEVLEKQNHPLVQLIRNNKGAFLRLLLEQPQEPNNGGDSGNQVGESEETEVEQPQADQNNKPNNGGGDGYKI
ncbi:hypothetical protein Bca52824_036886 [Brassica carinata]|uniref:Uncharacterized protein n=1 Tax=Brassica carinata TaxID=52824 RepID=A0A8X7SAD2_BRACI|nr:hypothetical protein Bca52824_036886 [Brassica carinata]